MLGWKNGRIKEILVFSQDDEKIKRWKTYLFSWKKKKMIENVVCTNFL